MLGLLCYDNKDNDINRDCGIASILFRNVFYSKLVWVLENLWHIHKQIKHFLGKTIVDMYLHCLKVKIKVDIKEWHLTSAICPYFQALFCLLLLTLNGLVLQIYKNKSMNKEHENNFFFTIFSLLHDFFLIVTWFLACCHVAKALQGLYKHSENIKHWIKAF